jgi:hypothetical protein
LEPIDPFSGEEIKKFLQVEFKINNHLYLDRIVDIAQGNPRLAVMAAQVAKDRKTLKSIRDVAFQKSSVVIPNIRCIFDMRLLLVLSTLLKNATIQ